jgi:hypothetical protein
VFLVNSRLSLDSAASSGFRSKFLHPNKAPLLPKLRGYFAEFLSHSCLDRLGILYLPTCVGFGTGTHRGSLEVFLGGRGSAARRQKPADIAPQAMWSPDFPRDRPTRLSMDNQRHGLLTFPRHPIAQTPDGGTGILTSSPSPTPVGLGLGPG